MQFIFAFFLVPCINKFKNCIEWASKGECSRNPPFMIANCRRSCTKCGKEITSQQMGQVTSIPFA